MRFLIITTQRSGSTWLVDLLNSHPGIASYTELFLITGRGHPNWGKYQDIPYWNTWRLNHHAWRNPGISRYLDALLTCQPEKGAIGFKLMYSQLLRYPEIILAARYKGFRILHLIRKNTLDGVLSGLAKKARRVAHAREQSIIPRVRMRVRPTELLNALKRREREQRLASLLIRLSGIPCLTVHYEDLVDNGAWSNTCLDFLECPAMPLMSTHQKMNPSSHGSLLENFDEVRDFLANTHFLGMLRP